MQMAQCCPLEHKHYGKVVMEMLEVHAYVIVIFHSLQQVCI